MTKLTQIVNAENTANEMINKAYQEKEQKLKDLENYLISLEEEYKGKLDTCYIDNEKKIMDSIAKFNKNFDMQKDNLESTINDHVSLKVEKLILKITKEIIRK